MNWRHWSVEEKFASGAVQIPRSELEQSLDKTRDQNKDKTETTDRSESSTKQD